MTDAVAPNLATESSVVRSRSLWASALRETFLRTGARVGLAWIIVIAVIAVFAPFLASSLPLAARTSDGRLLFPLFASLEATDLLWLVVPFAAVLSMFARVEHVLQRVVAVLWAICLAVPFLYIPVVRAQWPAWQASEYTVSIVVGVCGLALIVGLMGWLLSVVVVQNRRLAVVVGAPVGLVGLFFLLAPPKPPASIDYTQWRQLESHGQVAWRVRTIVPFSPNDRLGDVASKVGERDAAERTTGAATRPVTYAVYGPLPKQTTLQSPNRVHWLGTTYFGEDMLSRMIHASRVALTIGVISTGISTAIGIVVGALMGYIVGWFDLLGMRIIEIIEALPRLLVLLIITVSVGRNLYLMMAVIGLLSWTGNARFIRADFLRLRNLDFVQAGVALGLRRSSLLFRHMLPNGIAPVLVNASFGVAGAILLESTLSFLGLGLGPEDPSWGQLLEQARQGTAGFNWWIATFPGLSIFLTVFSYILIGEAMRDALDPKLKKRD